MNNRNRLAPLQQLEQAVATHNLLVNEYMTLAEQIDGNNVIRR